MADIKGLGYPLVYKAREEIGGQTRGSGSSSKSWENAARSLFAPTEKMEIRSEVRALTGMQKEALVTNGVTGTTWRLVSDEGPYLNGTDLAPFPLAFYTTGMALSFTDELLKHAQMTGVTIKKYRLVQDNFYTMEGSALRGDMIGGALPAELAVALESDAPAEVIRRLVAQAVQTSPAQVYMEKVLKNTFSLHHNGKETAVRHVAPSPHPQPDEPTPHLEAAAPLPADRYMEGIIIKRKAAETVFGVEGGAGSSLQAAQKRTLHVRGTCTLRDDGLKEVEVQLFKPLGSTFRFIGDDVVRERAPSSLAYLAAGVGFCFMTQIGRYATIVKQELKRYSIVQDTSYGSDLETAAADPVDTHVFLESGEDDEAAQRTLSMSERTCFLHAAMRLSNKSKVQIVLNGEGLDP